MKEFTGKVAVITGAGSGIGRSFSLAAAEKGMKVAVIDIMEEDAKKVAEECMAKGSPKAVAIKADVSVYEEVKASVETVMKEFGAIDIMFNNAGVWPVGKLDSPVQDWQWIIDVNVLGTAYYAHEVLPILEKQGTPCHYLITASIGGLIPGMNGTAPYFAAKHAQVALAESIRNFAKDQNLDMGVSVFCPEGVQTDIHNSEKRRPSQYTVADDPYYQTEEYKMKPVVFGERVINVGKHPDDMARRLFRAIEDNQMYIVTHSYTHAVVKSRFAAIEADMAKEEAIGTELGTW